MRQALVTFFLLLLVRASFSHELPIDFVWDGNLNSDTSGVRISHLRPGNAPVNNQIWSIAESESGWVFFAEEEGILAVKGDSWELLETPGSTTVRSLDVQSSPSGEILFFGEQGDFGYVTTDQEGGLKPISLKHAIPGDVAFTNVWNVHATSIGVFFQSREAVFRYWNGEITVWTSSSGFHNSFEVHGRYFVREFEVGLKEFDGNELSLVLGGESFADEIISGMVPNDQEGVAVWTQHSGIFVQQNLEARFDPHRDYSPRLEAIAAEFRLYHMAQMGPKRFALTTLGAGLLIVDDLGNVIKRLEKLSGFPDNTQNFVLKSRMGGMWIGLDNEGAAFIDSSVEKLVYGQDHGISGYINDVENVFGSLTVATGAGVFVTQPNLDLSASENFLYSSKPGTPVFRALEGLSIVWDIEEYEGWLWAATETGLFRMTGFSEAPQHCRFPEDDSRALPTQVFAVQPTSQGILIGLEDGLGIALNSGTTCEIARVELQDQKTEVRTVQEVGNKIYLGTAFDGVLRLNSKIERYGVNQVFVSKQFPPGRNDVIKWGEDLFVFNEDGLFGVEEIHSNGAFTLEAIAIGNIELSDVSTLLSQNETEAWLISGHEGLHLDRVSGTIIATSIPALRFDRSSSSAIFMDDSRVLWFNNGSELIRYDASHASQNRPVFQAGIRSVKNSSTGEAVFAGFFRSADGSIAIRQPKASIPELRFDSRSLSIEFVSTNFLDPEAVRYRYRVIGSHDEQWTDWTNEKEALISHLLEGSYTLETQALNDVGQISESAFYSFVILPPWYRTVWAYLAYLVFAVAGTVSGRKYLHMRRAHKLAEEQARELEREREVVKKLSEANDRLLQANKLKDEFLATTSHELRTPLTAILGFTSVLKEEIPEDAEYREFLDIIEDSGGRLMDTLNSLLDLAKLRAGIMEIDIQAHDVYQVAVQEVIQFQESAQKKGLTLKVHRPSMPLFANADSQGLKRILHNLVGNAIKFTDEGRVEVSFGSDDTHVHMRIRDTGIGIDAEFLPDLFNAFIQESDGLSRSHEGNGLGLAITSGIIQLMGAEIRVESEKGEGSTFIVSMPIAEAPRTAPRKVRGMGTGLDAGFSA